MDNLLVSTHSVPFTISDVSFWGITLGFLLAIPLGLPNLIAFNQTNCVVPIINVTQSVLNALFFYVYFVKHSLASAENDANSEFIFTD